MCFNEPISWTAFGVITLFNILTIIHTNRSTYTSIALIFQWVLLMQVFDALAWHDPTCGSSLNMIATRGAFLANVTQPIIAYFLLMYISKSSQFEKVAATVVVFLYIMWVINGATNVNITCLKNSDTCANLQYYWWSGITPVWFYHISLILIVLLLLKPFSLAVAITTIICMTFIISFIFYSCGVGSVWCFIAAFVPILNYIAYKYLK